MLRIQGSLISYEAYGSPSAEWRISWVISPKEVCLHNSASNGSFRQACSGPWGSDHSATGGCNNDAGCCGKNVCLNAWDCIKGNVSRWKVTGGADFTTKPVQLIGMRKGSVFVRGVAAKGSYAVWVVSGVVGNGGVTEIAKNDWVVRKTKGTWCVVLCRAKTLRSNWVSTSQ
jgi:hypothetical protein